MKNAGKFEKKHVAKECAFLAVFVALVLAVQLVLSFVPGVELVTVLFVSYAFIFGKGRGMVAATAFSLLRQFVFGVYPTVLVLYVVYFNLLAFSFGALGSKIKNAPKALWFIVVCACLGTICFTMADNVLNVLWYGYTGKTAKLYFMSSLPFMGIQTACTAVSVSVLFLPIIKGLQMAKKGL